MCEKKLKRLLIMTKLMFFLMIVAVTNTVASVYSQNGRLDIDVRDVPLRELFREIEKKSSFAFFFNDQFTELDKKVTVSKEDETIDNFLNDILKNTSLDYKILENNFIVIVPKEVFQGHLVKGVVTDVNGNPLPGVNIVESGTSNGTVTDENGNYTITVEDPKAVLVFSYVGYLAEEIPVDNQTTIEVALVEDIQALDEVVVIGYGTSKKRDIIGSVSSVSGEELAEVPSPSFDAALQGRASGIQVTQNGATPGGKVRVMVRGTNSISSGTEPLYIIDGIPVDNGITSKTRAPQSINPLATLNPNDIESIEVLKDAAATAIYGSRGSNGVILITTKTGKGESRTTFDVRTGISNPSNLIDFVDGDQWVSLINQARTNSGQEPFDPQTIVGDNDPSVTLPREDFANTDWYDVVLQQGNFQEYNFSTSKGMENTSYYISAQYRTEDGILTNNQFNRLNLRSNVDFKPTDNLTTGVKLSFSQVKTENVPTGNGTPGGNDNIAKGGWGQAVSGALPIFPIYNDDQTYFDPLSGNNLKASLNRDWYSDQDEQYRTLGTVFAKYNIPFIQGLSITGDLSVDLTNTTNIRYGGPQLRPDAVAYGFDEGMQYLNTNYDAYLSYDRAFADVHNLALTLGTETYHTQHRERNLEATNLTTSDQEIGAVAGDNVQRVVFGHRPETKFRGYFARANYNFAGKYYAGASYRRDGSSKFGRDNLFGNFTAFSAGWIMSEESFIKDNIPTLSFLKIRGSFGQTGNASIPQGITQTVFLTWTRYGNTGAGGRLNNIGASDITWETTNSYDGGIDFGLIQNRINGSLAYYYQDVSDMLLQVPIGRSNGANNIWANIGDLKNQGIEININTVNISNTNFKWSTNINFTTNNNEISSLTPILAESRAGIDANITTTRIGGRLGTYYIAASAGIDDTYGHELIYEVDNTAFLLNDEGDYVDESGNVVEDPVDNPDFGKKTGNVLPATDANVANNRYIHEGKTGLPTFFGGVNNTVSYKGISLSFLFSFQGGNYIYDHGEKLATNIDDGRHVIGKDYIDNYWTEANKDADYPALVWDNSYTYLNEDGEETTGHFNQQTDKYLHKGDFIRLRNLQLAYNLPASFVQRIGMQNLRIYLSAQNLLTFTKYPGLDPEVIAADASAQNRNLIQGVAGIHMLPQTRTFSAGISVTF